MVSDISCELGQVSQAAAGLSPDGNLDRLLVYRGSDMMQGAFYKLGRVHNVQGGETHRDLW